MASSPSISGIIGNSVGEAAAFAAGVAVGPLLEPILQALRNTTWSQYPDRPLDPDAAAQAVAEAILTLTEGASEAKLTGLAATPFSTLVETMKVAPGSGQLLEMLRHGTINAGNFTHGLRKARLEPMWDTPLEELQTVRLTPAELALGIVRSTVADPGLLVTTLDIAGSTIPAYPHWPGNALTEALAGGVDKDRLRVMVGSVGLPMSPQQAASATFRGIVNRAAFNLSILEGDIRPEYADAIFEQARQILTASEYVEAHLRGWIDEPAMYAGTAKHGMSQADTLLRFQTMGRPVTFHEITTGLARGGTYPSAYADIPEPYRKSAQESDIRPEWASLHYANRYLYPSAFVLRTLAQAGDLGNQAAVEQVLLEIGWKPSFAKQVSTAWVGGTAAADKDVTGAETKLKTTTHRSYIAEEIDDATATTALTAASVAAAAVPQILALWKEERALIRKQLTPAQIKKAWAEGAINPATGVAWTQAEALAALLARGYDQADATVLLEL